MSMRTLFEINHDCTHRLDDLAFVAVLTRYLASGSKNDAEQLERFGLRVIGMRHHADKFIIRGEVEGFPPTYLVEPKAEPRP